IADISYSVYLFHWPLFVIFSKIYPTWLAALITTILSVLFASVSFYFLEPLIRGKAVSIRKHKITFKHIMAHLGLGLTLPIGLGVYLCLQAPSISSLEKNLLLSGIQQDADQLSTTYVQAAPKPPKKENAQNSVQDDGATIIGRSEERRVGKECSCGVSRDRSNGNRQ